MEFNLHWPRLLLFAVAIGIGIALGVFTPLESALDVKYVPARAARGYYLMMVLFTVGAACVSLVDHYVGVIERTNLRLLYIIAGIIAMIVTPLWRASLLNTLRTTLELA